MRQNVIAEKSKKFALRIIALYKYLKKEEREFVLSKQVLRSGTSIGANVREAFAAQTDADFLAKLYISFKEAKETEYWLELLHESNYINDLSFDSIYKDCQEIIKILSSITKTQKEKQPSSIPNSNAKPNP